jgi:heme exporter protein A
MYGVPHLTTRLDEILALVGLEPRRKDLVRTYSRGMQQRLAIGRAVLHDPDVLLLDEPYTGLDQDACAMLDRVLHQVATHGRTIVMTSHDLTRVADLASRFDVLSRGVIVASQSAAEVNAQGLLDYYRQSLAEEKVRAPHVG